MNFSTGTTKIHGYFGFARAGSHGTTVAKRQGGRPAPPTYAPERVAQIRIKKAKMSQSVFAGFLNVTTSTVQKWESPVSGKHPGGAAAKLLQIIEKNGIEALAV